MVTPAQSRLIEASLAPAALGSQISSAIAAKSLNAQKQEGAAILKLLDSAANAGPGAGDPLTAQATGLGGLLDTAA